MAAKKRTRDFGAVIRAKLAANPELAAAVEEESFNADIAQQVYDLRTEARLTQRKLAELVGTQQSVISRIEDADYDGHSLSMLKKIARVLGQRLRVEFYAQPVFQEIKVNEFQLNWNVGPEWQPAIGGNLIMGSGHPGGSGHGQSLIPVSADVGVGAMLQLLQATGQGLLTVERSSGKW